MITEEAQKSSALHPSSAKYPKPCHKGESIYSPLEDPLLLDKLPN